MYDRDIRVSLLAQLRADPELFVRESYGGNTGSIADIIAVGDNLDCYEIKSDRDSLARLTPPRGSQIAHYSRVFDRVTVVAGVSHMVPLFHIVPPWWGISVAHPGDPPTITVVRAARDNPTLDLHWVAHMLWAEEARYIARLYEVARGCRGKNDLCRRLVGRLTRDELRAAVRFAIRSREYRGFYSLPDA